MCEVIWHGLACLSQALGHLRSKGFCLAANLLGKATLEMGDSLPSRLCLWLGSLWIIAWKHPAIASALWFGLPLSQAESTERH